MEVNRPTNFQIEKVVPYLLLNSSFISNIGLFHGKMGIVLFFAHYGRYTDNSLYDDFASELMEEISEDITANTSIDFENGLCGVGWGIEYLVSNGFMEGSSDEILEKLDHKVMEHDARRITDLSFRMGLGGILYYTLARLSSPRETGILPFDAQFISELRQTAQQATFKDEDQIPTGLVKNFLQVTDGILPKFSQLRLPTLLFAQKPDNEVDPETLPLGIEKGLTALCFSEILKQKN